MKFDPTLYLVTDSTGRTDDDFLPPSKGHSRAV